MTADFTYGPLGSADCEAVVALHRATSPAAVVARTIFTATRVGRYLADQIETRSDLWLGGAWIGEELAGYAYFRALEKSWHLDYVVVATRWQSRGLGRRLFEGGIADGVRRGHRRFTLDVDGDNLRALAWYRRRGFTVAERTRISIRELVPRAGAPPAEFLNRAKADRAQARYGFSELHLRAAGEIWIVGRLGEGLYRMRCPPSAAVEARLAALDPRRRLLLLEPLAAAVEAPPGETTLRLERLES